MEFTVDRVILQEAVQRTLGIVERKTTITILNNILIQAKDGKIRVVATDREIGLIADYDARITEPGEITVAARKLYEMVREIEGDTVTVKTNPNNWVSITCDKVHYRIPGITAEDFPEVREDEDVAFFSISCRMMKEMVSKTYFAMSTDDMRPGMNGSYFVKQGKKMEMVATDGHRLAMITQEIALSELSDRDVEGIIIPKKGINEIRRLVEDEIESIQLGISDHVCVVKRNGVMLRVSLIDSTYPEYGKVIPKDGGTNVKVDRNTMLHSLRRMSVMSNELFNGVKIHLADGKMTLNSINPDVGEANDELAVEYREAPMTVGYNVRYLIDAIEVIEEELISFEMRSNEGPGVIRAAGNDAYCCVVMPIKLGKE